MAFCLIRDRRFSAALFARGLDDIGLSLQHESEISAFEARRPAWATAIS